MSKTWEGGPSDADYEQNEGKPDLSTDDVQCVEYAKKCRRRVNVILLTGRDRGGGRKWVPT